MVSEPYPESATSLDDVGRRTRTLDLISGMLVASSLAVLELGGALAKKGFNASDAEVALLTSGQSLGLILSFFVAHRARRHRKKPLVFWPEVARSVALMAVYFIKPAFALAFVACHAAAQLFQAVTIPARVTIYRLNYPSALRGKIVGINRQVQFGIATVVSLLLGAVLDGWLSLDGLYGLFGARPPAPSALIVNLVTLVGFVGLLGTLLFLGIPVREAPDSESDRQPPESVLGTLRAFARVWRQDREFRRYQGFFFIFGFANIMSIPLTQIHAVDSLHADYRDLAMINVAIPQGFMALTMVFWGKLVDRHPPSRLRGYINLVFALDFLALAVGPNLGWVFAGRVCRGIALGGGTLVWMLGSLYYARSPAQVPIYLGVHTVLTGLRWALAPFAGVWLKAQFGSDARPVFFLVFLVVTVTALAMVRQSRKDPPRAPVDGPPMPAPRITGA